MTMLDIQLLQKIAGGVPAFQGLTTGMLHQLAKAGQLRTVPRGEVLCSEGDDSRQMWILLSGEIAVIAAGVELSVLDTSCILGEMSLMTGQPRCATLEVREEARIFEISRESFDELMTGNPGLASVVYRNIVSSLCDKLRETNQEVLRSLLSI